MKNNRFASFIFRTRGLYMFVALVVSIVLKSYLGGTTTLSLFITGLAVALVGLAFRMYSASYLRGRHAVREVQADFLATSGSYAHIRNPLYSGIFVVGIGVCIAINEWYAYALFVLGYVIVYSVVIPYEERFLEEKFGNIYAEYTAQTGRLIPKLRGYRGGPRVVPDYQAGILGEIRVPIVLAVIFAIIYLLFVR